jgi:branched-chain amino acid transport system substrate-binding protein
MYDLRTHLRFMLAAALIAWPAALPLAAPAADAPYEINAILSTTGPASIAGIPAAKGIKVFEDMVNAAGGIKGRPIKITISDDTSSPQVDVQLASALKDKKVPIVIGPMTTAGCNAIAPLVEKGGPVSLCISPYVEPGANPFLIAGGPTPAQIAEVTLHYFRDRGLTKFAMLNATDASGLALDKAFDAAFQLPENKTLTVVARQHFSPGDTSTAAQISQIKANAPQVLITWMVGSPFATVVRGAHDAGLDIPIVTNGANMSAGYMAQLAALLPRDIYFASFPGSPPYAISKPVAAVQAAQKNALVAAHIRPEGNVVGAWDAGLIAVELLKRLPSDPSAEQMRAALASLRGWAGTNGVYDFPAFPNRGSGTDGILISRYDAAINDFTPASKPGGAALAK